MNDKDCIVSVPVTLIPFLQNNDGTRMQMASNQMRQSLDIFHSEHPLVETGLEKFYTNQSDLCVIAPSNGVITYIHEKFMVMKLEKPEFGITDLKVIPTDRYDYYPFCIVGQEVRKGDILAKVKRFNNDSFKTILNGTNLLTAINGYYGFNYEDAIVVSESCCEKLSHQERITEVINFNEKQIPLSLVKDKYLPFLEPGTEVHVGDLLCMVKNSDLTNINELISPPWEKRSSCDGIVEKVDIYINNFHNSTRELSLYLNTLNNNNIEKVNDVLIKIASVYNAYSKKKIDTLSDFPNHIISELEYLMGAPKKSKWKHKNVEVNVLVKYTIIKKSHFNIGDKLANRHGNKGTCPLIVPDKDMLQINGKPIDLIINIMGIPGRMNLGQLYELWMSNVVNHVKRKASLELKKGNDEKAKDIVRNFYDMIDKTEKRYIYNSIDFENEVKNLISGLSFIAPPFESPTIYQLKEILETYKVATMYDVIDPSCNKKISMPLGYMFWEKLHHLSNEKISARSFGGYNKKTMQPLSGKKMKGGQKFGEMEVWSLLSHDADVLLKETLGVKSDDIEAKNKVLKNLIDFGKANLTEGSSKVSSVFKTYLQAIGLDLVDVEEKSND